MPKTLTLAICIAFTLALGATDIGDWSDIRFSGKTAAEEVFIRLENSLNPAADNTLLHYNGSVITEQPFTLLDPTTQTLQSSYAAAGENADLGLVAASTGQIRKVNPVYFGGTGMPALSQLTKLSTDPANDQSTNHLDIVADYFSFSGSKFYAAIQNRGGGFPLTGGLGFPPYYAYMAVIADPASDPSDPDTIVWALNYMQVAFGGIEPGLYKITGTGAEDLIRIGDISTEIVAASNLLKMSCNIAALLADPDFAAWYNPANPVLGVISMTSKTTLVNFQPVTETSDLSSGAKVYPKRLYNQLHPETLPQLNNYGFYPGEDEVFFSVDYNDAYGRFPLSLSAEWLPGQSFGLLPQSTDHSQTVSYRSPNLLGLLNEYDEVPSRAAASLDNLAWAYSATQPFSYILGLRNPQNVVLQGGTGGGQLLWDPVGLTLLGNPVEPDFYLVEAASEASFGDSHPLDEVYDTSLPVDTDPQRQFYRVRAVKNLP